MEEKIVDAALDLSPTFGIILGLLMFFLTGAGVVIVVLWRETRKQDNRERAGLERTLVLLDRVGEGMKAAERDREQRVQFEAEMRSAFASLSELRSTLVSLIRDSSRDVMNAIESKRK